MRAKIIQYNPTAGAGIAFAEGQQYEFTIREWRSNSAPAVGQLIELTLDNGKVGAIFVVGGDVIAREKASQLASHIGAQLSIAGTPDGILRQSLDYLSIPVLVAYVAYVLSVTMLNAFSINVFGIKQGLTLWNVADALGQMGAGGGVRFLVILAIGSIVVPIFWRDRRAWFAMFLPAAPLLKVGYDVLSAINAAKAQMGEMGGFGAAMGNAITSAVSVDVGLYIAVIAAITMAFSAFSRTVTRTEEASSAANAEASASPSESQAESIPATSAPKPSTIVTVADICNVCQTEIDVGNLFCGNCGQKL